MSGRTLLLLAFLQLLRMRKRRQDEKSDGNVLEALILPQGLHSLFQWICAYGLCIYLATASIMRTGQIFAQLFSGILHQDSASRISTIDNSIHFPEGSEPASAEREAQTPRLLNLRLPKDTQEEFQASSA